MSVERLGGGRDHGRALAETVGILELLRVLVLNAIRLVLREEVRGYRTLTSYISRATSQESRTTSGVSLFSYHLLR